MTRAAVFFDRDNTLIQSDGYLGDPAQVVLIAGAADAVAALRKLGFAIVTFSNQSGVARGLFGEDDVRAVNAKMDELLRAQNSSAIIDRHEFCPHHPEATIEHYRGDSDRRKPAPGMLIAAAKAMNLDLARCFVIGDAPRDIEAGHAAGCTTILFNDPALPRSPAAEAQPKIKPDHISPTLADAARFIESKSADASHKLRAIGEQILFELRRRNEPEHDFSVSKLIAGIAQVVAIAVVFLAYLNRNEGSFQQLMLFAIWVECLTIAMLMMERTR